MARFGVIDRLRRIPGALLITVLTGTVLAPAASAEPETVRVGVYEFAPLMHVRTAGEEDGLFIAILQHMAEHEGWTVEFVPGSAAEGWDHLRNGEVDLLAATTYHPDYETEFLFTRESVISTWAQVYAREGSSIGSVLDLADKKVGVVGDDPYNLELQNQIRGFNIECQFIEFKSYQDVLKGLREGWIDAGVLDRFSGIYVQNQNNITKTPVVFSPIELRFAALRGPNRELVSALDYHLAEIKQDYNSFYHRHLNQILGGERDNRFLTILRWALVASALLLALVVGLTLILRAQVKQKTAELSHKNAELQNEIEMRRNAEVTLRRQKEYLAALHDMSVGLISRLDFEDLLAAILGRAAALSGTQNAFFYLYNERTGQLEMRVGLGVFKNLVGMKTSIDRGLGGQVYQRQEVIQIENYGSWENRVPDSRLDSVHCILGIPLVSDKRVAGVLGLAHVTPDISFEAVERDALARLSELAAIALDNAQLYTQLQEELRQRRVVEEERVRLVTAIEQSADTMVITDVDGIILYVNPSVQPEMGYTPVELVGECLFNLMSDDADQLDTIRMDMMAGRSWFGRLQGVHKDGNRYPVEATFSPVRNQNGEITNYVHVRRDITNEVRVEQQLRQSQKMEAIGTLAGGIAHDFNNILVPIMGYSELLKEELDPGSSPQRNAEQVYKAAARAKDLVKQILTFSRQKEEEKKPLLVQSVLKEVLKLLRASLPSTIEIRQTIDSDSGAVMADATQLHQVLMNLCTNAYHAMRESGGVLDVSLSRVTLSSHDFLKSPTLTEGPYIRLSVSDTGHGMSPETLERIFEPYFTTKAPGEGTGMGLALVHGIIHAHGGHINVYSEPDLGTTFHIYLPEIREYETDEQGPETEVFLGGTERILLVDDEPLVLQVVEAMLDRLGYAITTCQQSVEALEMVRARPNAFDLILTDQTMPRMTGLELARQIQSIRPDLPIILCTGFSESVTEENARKAGIRRFLFKPVIRSELAAAIRDAVNGNGARRPQQSGGMGIGRPAGT